MIPSKPNHPNAWKNGQIRDYRLAASNALGKALPEKTMIHHYKDELIICQDNAYHKLLHQRQRSFEATGDASKRRCVICKKYDSTLTMFQRRDNSYYHKNCWRIYKNTGYRKRMTEIQKEYELRKGDNKNE